MPKKRQISLVEKQEAERQQRYRDEAREAADLAKKHAHFTFVPDLTLGRDAVDPICSLVRGLTYLVHYVPDVGDESWEDECVGMVFEKTVSQVTDDVDGTEFFLFRGPDLDEDQLFVPCSKAYYLVKPSIQLVEHQVMDRKNGQMTIRLNVVRRLGVKWSDKIVVEPEKILLLTDVFLTHQKSCEVLRKAARPVDKS